MILGRLLLKNTFRTVKNHLNYDLEFFFVNREYLF